MNLLLFKTVRISGHLHYGGSTPHPTLMEAESISEVGEESEYQMRSLEGIFTNSYYPPDSRWPQ